MMATVAALIQYLGATAPILLAHAHAQNLQQLSETLHGDHATSVLNSFIHEGSAGLFLRTVSSGGACTLGPHRFNRRSHSSGGPLRPGLRTRVWPPLFSAELSAVGQSSRVSVPLSPVSPRPVLCRPRHV